MMNAVSNAVLSDDQLCRQARAGDREAFSQIVERYQSLVCSLAYSACGDLAGSEDLGQETFLTAWQALGELREPSRLRAWLCGIVRNLTLSALRRNHRGGGPAKSLEAVAEPASTVDPALQVVSREEANLLWRSLSQLPLTYRQPMVLFYREGQSILEVSQSLDLSEDAVRQRLSRGRAMLRDEMASVVEETLTRSRPTGAFTASVMALLPAAYSKNAGAAVVASATSATVPGAKSLLAAASPWAILGPALGLTTGLLSSHVASSSGRSPEERAYLRSSGRRIVVFAWLMSAGLALAFAAADRIGWLSPMPIIIGVSIWIVALVGTILWAVKRMDQEVLRIRSQTGTDDVALSEKLATRGLKLNGAWVYQSRFRLMGLPLLDVAIGDSDVGSYQVRRAVGWIAIGDVALSPLIALGGFAAGPFALGGITVGILSFSLWGVALGTLAFGSVAAGWWSFGMAAIGWKSAAGAAVIARDYAMGPLALAAEANTAAAKEWFATQWFAQPVAWFVASAHWMILAIIVVSLGRVIQRSRMIRKASGPVVRP